MNSEIASGEEFTDELRPGETLLQGQYVIERFLNSGGFGMTYIARDSLNRPVVIKECFPAALCTRSATHVQARSRANREDFRSIVRSFIKEAQRLSKLEHPNIVGVHQIFEDNDTAYMALDFIDGRDLLDVIENDHEKLAAAELQEILMKILGAVQHIHEQNILHRDISPDNILLDRTGKPVLIDFGAAREAASQSNRIPTELLMVKDGYSPQEFYVAGSEQSPSSDLYALAATFYHLLTGNAPPSSQIRLAEIAAQRDDPYVSVTQAAGGHDIHFLTAIDESLRIFPKDRLQSAADWLTKIDTEKRHQQALARAQQDKEIDLSISKMVSEANQKTETERQELPTSTAGAFAIGASRAPRNEAMLSAQAHEANHLETDPTQNSMIWRRPFFSRWRRSPSPNEFDSKQTGRKRFKSPIRIFGRTQP